MTEPNAALAGAMSTMSFARFMASMAIFNEERTLSRLFDRGEFASMVETGGRCGKTVRRAGCDG
jgi:hypothetical protein